MKQFGLLSACACLAALLSTSAQAEPPTAPTLPPPMNTAKTTVAAPDLSDPVKKEIAMQIVCSAENSSLDWRAQYAYIEDIGDGRGYTAGIIGFCSGTGDMLEVIEEYDRRNIDNRLAVYLPTLRAVNNSASHAGLDPNFVADWKASALDPYFQAAQDKERDDAYFEPALRLAKSDGLRALGQFAYFDAAVMHGTGLGDTSLDGIRAAALKTAKPPSQGGDETAYLNAFLDARAAAMRTEPAHADTSRVDTAQRVFLQAGNLDLNLPLQWKVYGEDFQIERIDLPSVSTGAPSRPTP